MNAQTKHDQLQQLVTPEFLATLLEVSKLYGLDGDYFEISKFVKDLHDIKSVEVVITDPYIIED